MAVDNNKHRITLTVHMTVHMIVHILARVLVLKYIFSVKKHSTTTLELEYSLSYSSTFFCTRTRTPVQFSVLVLILMKKYLTTTVELEFSYSYTSTILCTRTHTHEKVLDYNCGVGVLVLILKYNSLYSYSYSYSKTYSTTSLLTAKYTQHSN